MIYKTMQVVFHTSMEADRMLNTMAMRGWELVTWIPFDGAAVGTPGASGFLVFGRHTQVDPDKLPDQREVEEPSGTDTARGLF